MCWLVESNFPEVHVKFLFPFRLCLFLDCASGTNVQYSWRALKAWVRFGSLERAGCVIFDVSRELSCQNLESSFSSVKFSTTLLGRRDLWVSNSDAKASEEKQVFLSSLLERNKRASKDKQKSNVGVLFTISKSYGFKLNKRKYKTRTCMQNVSAMYICISRQTRHNGRWS